MGEKEDIDTTANQSGLHQGGHRRDIKLQRVRATVQRHPNAETVFATQVLQYCTNMGDFPPFVRSCDKTHVRKMSCL